MRRHTLHRLRCPAKNGTPERSCGAALGIAPTPAPRATNVAFDEVEEGVLECTRCGTPYPIVGGVAILVSNLRDYLHKNGAAVLEALKDSPPSPGMLRFLRTNDLNERSAHQTFDDPDRIQGYLAAHYNDLVDAITPAHPLADLLRLDQKDGMWAVIDRTLGTEPPGSSLDLGCGVGGMIWRLVRQGATPAFGIDLSFPSVFAGRRTLLDCPTPSSGYTWRLEGNRGLHRPLDVIPAGETTDLFVASAMEPPLRDSFHTVAALNLIDIVPGPRELLARATDSIAPGGRILISSPYAWNRAGSPSREWIGGSVDKPSVDEMRALLRHHRLHIEVDHDSLTWIRPEYERWYHIYLVHFISARRPAGTA